MLFDMPRAHGLKARSTVQVLVTLVSGAMMGEECLLPTTLAMPFVAKAAEWLDLLYIDRRYVPTPTLNPTLCSRT